MNKYEIIGVIDEGAYGLVIKALNKVTNEVVAIKRFKDTDEDQGVYKNIQREIQMLKTFKSDYVVDLKQAFRKNGRVYLVFEYMEKNLLNIMEEHSEGVFKKLIAEIIYKLVRAIYHLHSNNAIHRDIKPENILISQGPDIKLKLCDFGFARTLPQGKMTDYVATRWYRSPQLLLGEQYGKQVDMWAIGCILGQMIDGQPMFAGQNQLDQIFLIKKMVGSLTSNQEGILKSSKRFHGIKFPEIKIREPLQMRYLNKIDKLELSFLKSCLKVNAHQRLTAAQALKHPYLEQFYSKDSLMIQQKELIHSRKRSYPEMSTIQKSKLEEKNQTFSGKKFSLQTMFSKELGKYSIINEAGPRKIGDSSQFIRKQHTVNILPKLASQKTHTFLKGHVKTSSLQLKVNKIKSIYSNFPVKFRQSKQKISKP